jgi:RHS repeat-associated protein
VSYDANGSNTGNTFRGTTRTQIWDEESRLKEVKIGGTTVVKFRYSDEGERTKKQATTPQLGVNGDSWYVNQFYTLLAGKRPTKHIFAGETRVASKTDAIWMQTPVTHYYHPDHLGTTSYVTDARQALVQHERYFPFGELWRGGGPQEETDLSRPNGDRKEWLFTSKEFDVETGLYYFGARYLDPRIGVWQSTDPILADYMLGAGFGGAYTPSNLGLYTYSRNNPIVLRDPDGRLAPVVVFLIMVAAGSAGSAGGRALDNLISGRPASPGVAAAATGGGVTAALAFTTGGTSLGTQMVGVGLASTIGGGVSRGIETGDAQMTLENMSVDFTLGAGMTLAAGLMTPARPPVRSTISESQVQSVLRSQPEIVASKTAAEMGDDLANAIGRNRVSARTAGGQQIDIDLRGKAHFEKSLGQKVPTPHVRESRVNVGPGGRTSLSDSKVRPATKQDIRTARSIVERR